MWGRRDVAMHTICGQWPSPPGRQRTPRVFPWMVYLVLVFALLDATIADNLALLSGTLKTYQRAGCDDEVVTLKCPHGTSISVQVAQYGKSAPLKSLCPHSEKAAKTSSEAQANVTCLWPNALQEKWQAVPQGTWGRTVVEACQKKRQCKFQTSPKTFGGDPCPGVRKYVEVAYKCRPYEFRSKVACENDNVQLACNPNSRIAVYSASYGRTAYDSIQCSQPQGVPEETCLVSYATETVMQFCHGKRRCALTADAATFGNPCKPESRMYLKVVYTCVPRKVLKERFEGQTEDDETAIGDDEGDDIDGSYGTVDEVFQEPAAFSPSPNLAGNNNASKDSPHRTTPKPPVHNKNRDTASELGKARPLPTPRVPPNTVFVPRQPRFPYPATKDVQGDDISDEKNNDTVNCTITVYTNEKTRVIGFITEWINAYNFLQKNQEKMYLYLILSVTAGLLLVLGLVIGRLLVQRHRARRDAKFHATAAQDHSLPNGFADDISEIDADIDLTTPVPVISSVAEVVRFGGTLRRGDAESAAPRSLNRSGNSQYYYG